MINKYLLQVINKIISVREPIRDLLYISIDLEKSLPQHKHIKKLI